MATSRLPFGMRRAVLLLVALSVVLAGCGGGDLAGDDQATTVDGGTDEETGGDSGSDSDGDSADASGDRTWEFMDFSEPARYVFELRSEDEPEPGTLVWDVTEIDGDTVTVHMTFEMGDKSTESTVTGDPETVRNQLLVTPAASFLVATWFSPSVSYYEDRALEVGEKWSYSTGEGSASFAVTGTETMAGVECYRSEMKVDGSIVYEGCFAPELGLAPYTGYYDEDGTQTLAVELVEYEQH